jgi:organic radical activating enzyme
LAFTEVGETGGDKMTTEFAPDLLVEVTSVCDRACVGCYAPNVVSSQGKSELFKTNPEFFLEPSALQSALEKLDHSSPLRSIAIRGGEPSRHPHLPALIAIVATKCSRVIVETHGRWILEASSDTNLLLQVCKDQNVQLKISFDRMHGLAANKLNEIWSVLQARAIEVLIAITEPSEPEFAKTRSLIPWVPESHIIFQRTASSDAELIRPHVGVISRRGQLSLRLTSRLDSKKIAAGVA